MSWPHPFAIVETDKWKKRLCNAIKSLGRPSERMGNIKNAFLNLGGIKISRMEAKSQLTQKKQDAFSS